MTITIFIKFYINFVFIIILTTSNLSEVKISFVSIVVPRSYSVCILRLVAKTVLTLPLNLRK